MLAGAAIISGILSLVPLFLWLVFAKNIATGQGFFTVSEKYAPHLLESLSSSQVLLVQAREYFCLVGGTAGWLALFSFAVMANRPLKDLPKSVIVGCLVGVAAAITMPAPLFLAAPPVLAVAFLLVRAYLASPKNA